MRDKRATKLGKIIGKERKKKNILQEELLRGLCQQGEMAKIETGERVPEKMLADALMQRLGRCTDTLEAIMSVEEYILFDMRETLQRHFYECNYEKNCNLIRKYRRHKEAEQPLHQQFLLKYEAVNEYRRHGDMSRCRMELGNALAVTFPEWERMQIANYYLCSQELHLLILIAFFMMADNEVRAFWILTEVAAYLEERYYEEEKVKLLPQCMWLLAKYSKHHGDWERVEEYSRRGVECLTRNGALPLLRELLELRIESLGKLGGSTTMAEALQNQLESLVAVLAQYADWVLGMDDLSRLHYFYHEEEVSLDYEMLRDIRKNQGIPQGDVQSCTQGSLSRIENGKQTPSKRHVMEIAEELGVSKSYYISRVQSEDYDLYELCHWKNQANFHREWERSLELLDKLEAALDMSIPINRQYIEVCRVWEKKIQGKAELNEILLELEKILRYTMPDYCEGKIRVPSREEFVILNQMAGIMRKTGKLKDGLCLWERILKVFYESRVKAEYHTNSLLLLYMCYGETLESVGELETAKKVDILGIQLDIQCGKGEMLGKILANLAYVYDKDKKYSEKIVAKNCLWCAYQLCLLMGQTQPAKIVEKCYKSLFGEYISGYINDRLIHLPQMDL
ncbi:MAG: helix-turn-helix transcriptional regulator [Lachnospiraceae bacterium]|nr:helix-turn-helix transcriptional regulator [Lachnospiraceae bacterium]